MEVSGMYLLAGYKSGALVVWDVKTAQVYKIMRNIHSSEVVGASIYSQIESIGIVSVEANGPVCQT